MSIWRTILEVSGEEKYIVCGNFDRVWNFSRRFTEFNFVLFSIHCNILSYQTAETWLYSRATKEQENKSNENTQFTNRLS